ncbi:MAG: flagellar basal body rod protein FlgB [Deltaproteobacteria bacterium]|nr:flagellar basal body rod protein FlgB [Deltaproteobacteria bacterium]
MPLKSLFGKTFNAIEQSLDLAKMRHGLIASNIANLNTPNYRTKDIDFNKILRDVLSRRSVELVRTNSLHFPTEKSQIESCEIFSEEPFGSSGGSVDIDNEMTKLAENNLRYQTGVELLLRKFSTLKHTIAEGGR